MNLADLEKTFWGDQREQPTQVRLARVVNALREEAGPTIRMLEIQAAECFPEINEHGQKHFVRVVMESAAEELKEILGDPEAATAGAIQPQGEGSDRKTNEFGEGQRAGRVPQGVSQVDRRRDGDAGSAEGSSVCFVRHDAEASKSAHVTGRDEAGRVHHVGGEGHHCLNEKVAGGSTSNTSKAIGEGGALSAPGTPTPAAAPVCVWTATAFDPLGYAWFNSACGLVDFHEREVDNEDHPKCPGCRSTISFKEAAR